MESLNNQPINQPPETNNNPKTLNNGIKLTIAMIGVATLFCLGMLLFGDMKNYSANVWATLTGFAVFTVFSSIDVSSKKSAEYINVALGLNIYLLLTSIYLIWFKAFDYDEYAWADPLAEAIFAAIILGFMTRIALFAGERVSRLWTLKYPAVVTLAKATVALIGLTLTLYSYPLIFTLNYASEDTYWKVALASLILLGVSISIMAILYVYYTKDEREAKQLVQRQQMQQIYAQQKMQQQQMQQQNNYPAQSNYNPSYQQQQSFVHHQAQGYQLMMPDNITPVPLLQNGMPNMEIYQQELLRIAQENNNK